MMQSVKRRHAIYQLRLNSKEAIRLQGGFELSPGAHYLTSPCVFAHNSVRLMRVSHFARVLSLTWKTCSGALIALEMVAYWAKEMKSK